MIYIYENFRVGVGFRYGWICKFSDVFRIYLYISRIGFFGSRFRFSVGVFFFGEGMVFGCFRCRFYFFLRILLDFLGGILSGLIRGIGFF